jgi:DNA repair protein RecO (recombination protein O)
LVLRSLPYGEADLVATVFTEAMGVISVLAKSARTFRRGAPRSLEPMHTLRLGLTERPGAELLGLRSAAIEVPRLRLTADLERMQAAGRALRWLRRSLPPRTPEPETWNEITCLLDALDAEPAARPASLLLAEFGVALTAALGYGLNLHGCVRCGKPCDLARSAYLDPSLGGLVCRHCGGAGVLLRAELRGRLLALYSGTRGALIEQDAQAALELVDATLRAHAGVEPDGGPKGGASG